MISNNFWKGLSETGLEELVALFQLCWETRTSPHQWKIVQAIGTSAFYRHVTTCMLAETIFWYPNFKI